MTDIVAIGESMGSVRLSSAVVPGVHAEVSFGGAESNVAIGVSRLGHSAAWIGSLGKDAFGDAIVRRLRAEGVDIKHVSRSDHRPTGLLVTHPGGLGRRVVDYHRVSSAGSHIHRSSVEAAIAEDEPRIVHISGITSALSEEAAAAIDDGVDCARKAGLPISFDINYRSSLWDPQRAKATLRSLADRATIVFGGRDELTILTDASDPADAARVLLDSGVREVVVKGSKQARVYATSGVTERASYHVQVVDPIGAGDAFVSGYLSGTLDGLDTFERLGRAHLTAAFAISQMGDWEGLPFRYQIDSYDEFGDNVER